MTESLLNLGPLLVTELRNLVPRGVVRGRDLVEGVVRVLLKLLPDPVLPLLHAQADAAAVRLHLLETPLLVLGIRGGESSLGVSVDLVVVAARRQGQGVEGVVDTGGADCRGLVVVELREVEAASLLDGGL